MKAYVEQTKNEIIRCRMFLDMDYYRVVFACHDILPMLALLYRASPMSGWKDRVVLGLNSQHNLYDMDQ